MVSFDIPFPASYGGVIDVYFKITELKMAGYKIILHCFLYHREKSEKLETLCDQVFYYSRFSFWRFLFDPTPMFVASRANPKLLNNLASDEFPILFEGIQCCAFLGNPNLAGKKQWVRMHNQESVYYSELARQTSSLFSKLYYRIEAKRILNFENRLRAATGLFAISASDRDYFKKFNNRVELLWPFHGYHQVLSNPGKGDFILYHANFSIPENREAVRWLLKSILPNVKLILAGSGWSDSLIEEASKRSRTEVLINPDEETMENCISNAQLIVLPTFQPTGVKLKLLQSLFRGRHILANNQMVAGTPFHELCHLFTTAEELNAQILRLIDIPFSDSDLEKRRIFLNSFSDRASLQILVQSLEN